jgi:hypothetical protein
VNLEDFHALAEAYGGDLARWPAARRAGAEALAATSPAAAAALGEARALDGLLAAAPRQVAGAALEARIARAAPAARRPGPGPGRWLGALAAGAALAAACAAGTVTGVAAATREADPAADAARFLAAPADPADPAAG